MYVSPNIEVRSCNHCCRGKAVSITYSEGVLAALVIQHEKCMRRIVLSPVACPAYHIFPLYLIKGTIFRGKKSYWKQNACFDFLYKILSEKFLIL